MGGYARKARIRLVLTSPTPICSKEFMTLLLGFQETLVCNLTQWRHIFSLITIPAAEEPSRRKIMIPLYEKLVGRYYGYLMYHARTLGASRVENQS